MGWLFWAGIFPVGLIALSLMGLWVACLGLREVHEERARLQFRPQREWLEARFLGALSRLDPIERLRWEDADWNDEILWARDRQTRRLLALIGVRFAADPFTDESDLPPRHATALFEFRGGRWMAEGKRLDEVRPDEVLLRHQRFLPVVLNQRRA